MTCTECGGLASHKMDCSRRFIMPGPIQWTAVPVSPPMPVTPTQQSVPLVAGSVIGMRAWRCDGHHLWPVAVQGTDPWQPGENQSKCHSGVGPPLFEQRCANPDCELCIPGLRHTFAAGCTCGFYAVFNHRHVPHGPTYGVMGIIEGYGRVVIGPGGFRASKARVLALCPADLLPVHSLRPDLPPQWRQVPWFRSLHAAVTEFPVTDPTPYLPPPVTRVIEGESQ